MREDRLRADRLERASQGRKVDPLVLRCIWVNKDCEVRQIVIMVDKELEVGRLLLALWASCILDEVDLARGRLQLRDELGIEVLAPRCIYEVDVEVGVQEQPRISGLIWLVLAKGRIQKPGEAMYSAKAVRWLAEVEDHGAGEVTAFGQGLAHCCGAVHAHREGPLLEVPARQAALQERSVHVPHVLRHELLVCPGLVDQILLKFQKKCLQHRRWAGRQQGLAVLEEAIDTVYVANLEDSRLVEGLHAHQEPPIVRIGKVTAKAALRSSEWRNRHC
mmetsp:Transcript_3576/g.10545  ORF Transcript_3576/g.10545 Transcript_3576/m.10545 type:complete len:276 (-) Transcript_3576:127-954(-)